MDGADPTCKQVTTDARKTTCRATCKWQLAAASVEQMPPDGQQPMKNLRNKLLKLAVFLSAFLHQHISSQELHTPPIEAPGFGSFYVAQSNIKQIDLVVSKSLAGAAFKKEDMGKTKAVDVVTANVAKLEFVFKNQAGIKEVVYTEEPVLTEPDKFSATFNLWGTWSRGSVFLVIFKNQLHTKAVWFDMAANDVQKSAKTLVLFRDLQSILKSSTKADVTVNEEKRQFIVTLEFSGSEPETQILQWP